MAASSVTAARGWVYVRRDEQMRVIVDGTSVLVYGPAHRYVHSAFSEELDATLYQAQLEDDLVRRGWSLELLTTHRRVRPRTPPPSRRDHSTLRLVA